MIRIVQYVARDGKDRFGEWVRAQPSPVRTHVQARINRIRMGNFGDHRGLGQGVSELRIHSGPGYRVYYGRDGNDLVILLVGGTKRRQAGDIAQAQALWREYKQERQDADSRV